MPEIMKSQKCLQAEYIRANFRCLEAAKSVWRTDLVASVSKTKA